MKENKKQKIREGLADLAAKAEQDHEIQMARSELYKLSKYSIKLHDLLKTVSEAEGLQAWQQSYITKAADYIDAVYHDIEYEKSVDAEIGNGIDSAEAEITAEPVEESVKSPYITELSQKLNKKIRRGR
jgi:ribosome assembly protein YihI (activator of Der GTPase)